MLLFKNLKTRPTRGREGIKPLESWDNAAQREHPRQVLRKNKSASTYPYSDVVTRKGNPSRRSTRAIFCVRRPNKFRREASSAPRNTPSARASFGRALTVLCCFPSCPTAIRPSQTGGGSVSFRRTVVVLGTFRTYG